MPEGERDKAELRRRMRRRRAELDDEARARAHRAMRKRLLELAHAHAAGRVGVYAARGSEADPEGFAASWLAAGGEVAWPRVADGGTLHFHRLDDPSRLTAGFRGIREPPRDAFEVPVAELDLLVVPGVAFDASGGRLGQGAGYYDRLLDGEAARGSRGLVVGLAYACQLVSKVPVGPKDQPVDAIVTEEGILRTR